MSKIKKTIFFVLIFVLLLIFTSLLIYYNSDDNSYASIDREKGIELNSFYDENSITFQDEEMHINDYTYSYLQIEGLKKSKVENNINKNIKNEVRKFIGENNHLDNFKMVSVGNFGNILSLYISGEKNQTNVYKFLNYNLVSGDMLKFNDLFTSNAPVDKIIKESIYTYLISNEKCTIDNNGDLIENNKACKLIKQQGDKYIELYKNSNFQFMFDNVGVKLLIGDLFIDIPYIDYAEYFNLYSKFLTNVSIYKNDKIGQKDILIASYRDNGIYSILDYYNDDKYVDLAVFADEAVSDKVIEGITNVLRKELDGLSNSKEFVFINQDGRLLKEYDYYLNLNQIEDVLNSQYDIYHLSLLSNVYNMQEEYFDNNIKSKIYQIHRTKESRNSNLLNLPKDKNIKKLSFEKEYIILSNGELLNSVEDLFVSGYDYKQTARDILINNYNIKEELLQDELEYSYILYNSDINKAYTFVVKGDKFGECYIPFSAFDNNMMNI